MDRFLNNFPIQRITPEGPSFPEQLKNISESPKELFFRGELPKQNDKLFAIVGTRLCSDYGKEIAFSIAKDLSQAGLIIVSGMALGIDTFSHKGALETTGDRPPMICPTVAVLGTGLDEASIYPSENLKLARQILEKGGCLISEYPEGTRGANFTFPQRNRIIAAISLGVLVVEAKMKSGALITADYAKKYKRKIFAVPGNIHSQNSKGCHWLIKQGAKLAENANDILQELNLPELKARRKEFETPEQQLVFNALGQGALHIDKIIEKSQLPPQAVSGIISIMEMENKIKNLGANVYAINR